MLNLLHKVIDNERDKSSHTSDALWALESYIDSGSVLFSMYDSHATVYKIDRVARVTENKSISLKFVTYSVRFCRKFHRAQSVLSEFNIIGSYTYIPYLHQNIRGFSLTHFLDHSFKHYKLKLNSICRLTMFHSRMHVGGD